MVGSTLRGSGKPKPFQRKSITISTEVVNEGVKKEWQDVSPRDIEVGDIILGKGLVASLGDVVQVNDPRFYYFYFEMKNGTTHRITAQPIFPPGGAEVELVPHVRVFTRVRG